MTVFLFVIYAFFLFIIGSCIISYIVGKIAYKKGVEDERRGLYIHSHRYGWKEEDFKH